MIAHHEPYDDSRPARPDTHPLDRPGASGPWRPAGSTAESESVRSKETHKKNNRTITSARYLFVIEYKRTGCLLWQPVWNVIAGHSWCKGEGRS